MLWWENFSSAQKSQLSLPNNPLIVQREVGGQFRKLTGYFSQLK